MLLLLNGGCFVYAAGATSVLLNNQYEEGRIICVRAAVVQAVVVVCLFLGFGTLRRMLVYHKPKLLRIIEN